MCCLLVYLHFVDCHHLLLSTPRLCLRFVPPNHRQLSLSIFDQLCDWRWSHLLGKNVKVHSPLACCFSYPSGKILEISLMPPDLCPWRKYEEDVWRCQDLWVVGEVREVFMRCSTMLRLVWATWKMEKFPVHPDLTTPWSGGGDRYIWMILRDVFTYAWYLINLHPLSASDGEKVLLFQEWEVISEMQSAVQCSSISEQGSVVISGVKWIQPGETCKEGFKKKRGCTY